MSESPISSTRAERSIYVIVSPGEASDIMEDLPLGQSASEATRNLFVKLRDALRNPSKRRPAVPQSTGDVDFAPLLPVRPIPDRAPRRGYIVRKKDVTGISGLGVIAEICVFSDDFTVIRWLGGGPQNQPKHEIYDNPGPDPFIQISGHNGNTEIVWLDEEYEPSAEVPLDQ